MGVVQASGAGIGVDLGGPRAFVAAVVGERGDRDPEAFVAGPAEVHGAAREGCYAFTFDDTVTLATWRATSRQLRRLYS